MFFVVPMEVAKRLRTPAARRKEIAQNAKIVVDDTRRKCESPDMKNETAITELTRKLGLGSHASHGVKAVLGKMPINMSDSRADSVLAELQSRYDATEEGQAAADQSEGWIEDAPMCPAAARRQYQLRK